eukprot:8599004-Alexandrium_andersonii.AAC.1
MGKGKADVAATGATVSRGLPLREGRLDKGPDDRNDSGLGNPAETSGKHQGALTLRPRIASLLGDPHKQFQ